MEKQTVLDKTVIDPVAASGFPSGGWKMNRAIEDTIRFSRCENPWTFEIMNLTKRGEEYVLATHTHEDGEKTEYYMTARGGVEYFLTCAELVCRDFTKRVLKMELPKFKNDVYPDTY